MYRLSMCQLQVCTDYFKASLYIFRQPIAIAILPVLHYPTFLATIRETTHEKNLVKIK